MAATNMDEDAIIRKIDGLTAPEFDPRWPNVNVTNRCWQEYLDFHRCVKKLDQKGMNTKLCGLFEFNYKGYCPRSWYEKWDAQREEGRYAPKI